MNNVVFLDYNGKFHTRLRELLDEHKITKQKLSEEIEVSRQAISQYCDGSTIPNADKLLKISEYFNVSTDYLLGKTDIKSSDTKIIDISQYTGLSEKAISILHKYIDLFGYSDSINFLIEYSHTPTKTNNSDLFEFPDLLSKFRDYLTIFPKDNKAFSVTESGELLDFQDEKLWEVLGVAEIDTDTIIEQILLNNFVDELRQAKKCFIPYEVKSNGNNNEA